MEKKLPRVFEKELLVELQSATLEGTLSVPEGASGLVVFVHGSGSSRFSPRNRYVANQLVEQGLATFLFDLLTEEEEILDLRTRHLRFNIDFLADRLSAVCEWLREQPETKKMNFGLFGASTGAAAALIVAAQKKSEIFAVVSRGGRPDLAGSWLSEVHAPTLLIVGEWDSEVIELNEKALWRMKAAKKVEMEIVPRATHLFEEEGALERVSGFAADWFLRFLKSTIQLQKKAS